jgi:large exoprotein involved in heme utilization and adhesion
VIISGTSNVHTQTSSDGPAGDISIQAARFTLTDHATLNADTFGSNNAGAITITATQSATIAGSFTTVGSRSDFGATGHAGRITVTAPVISMERGGGLSTQTTGEGMGGNIELVATRTISLSDGARISATSTGSGNAGNIQIHAGQSLTIEQSSITAEATHASGGNLKIQASDLIRVVNSTLSSSVQGNASTAGGNITIDPNTVVLQNGHILASAVQGSGGHITITTPVFLADSLSRVDASSQFGLNGSVTIQSPTSNLSGTVGQLVSKTSQPQVLVQNRCVALAGGEQSTFILAGRDTRPTEPGGWLLSPVALLNADEAHRVGRETGSGTLFSADEKPSLLSVRRLVRPGFRTQLSAAIPYSGCAS